jgi:hypothetical protein
VPNGKAALDRLLEVLIPILLSLMQLRCEAMESEFAQHLREKMNGLPIMLILNKDQPISGEVAANIVLRLPFTHRKLINRIVPFVAKEGKHVR